MRWSPSQWTLSPRSTSIRDTLTLTWFIRSVLRILFYYPVVLASDLGDFAKLTVRFMPLNASSRAFIISSVSGRVALNPPWYRAAQGFVVLGINHILSGIDHLLFLLCLVIPLRRLPVLLPVITAFTLALGDADRHSL